MKIVSLSTILLAASLHAVSAATPLVLTGANADIIYEGAVGSATAFDIPNNYTFLSSNIGFGGTIGNPGIPQTFTSLADSSVQFALLGAANQNNVLQLGEGQSGTLTVTTPSAFSSLYFLTSSAQGSATGVVTLTFSDASTVALNYTSSDWYNSGGTIAYQAPGSDGIRVNTVNGGFFFSGAGKAPYLFSSKVDIPVQYQGLALQSMTFAVNTSTPTANTRLSSAIFGVSGVATVPEPSALVLGSLGLLALGRRRRN